MSCYASYLHVAVTRGQIARVITAVTRVRQRQIGNGNTVAGALRRAILWLEIHQRAILLARGEVEELAERCPGAAVELWGACRAIQAGHAVHSTDLIQPQTARIIALSQPHAQITLHSSRLAAALRMARSAASNARGFGPGQCGERISYRQACGSIAVDPRGVTHNWPEVEAGDGNGVADGADQSRR